MKKKNNNLGKYEFRIFEESTGNWIKMAAYRREARETGDFYYHRVNVRVRMNAHVRTRLFNPIRNIKDETANWGLWILHPSRTYRYRLMRFIALVANNFFLSYDFTFYFPYRFDIRDFFREIINYFAYYQSREWASEYNLPWWISSSLQFVMQSLRYELYYVRCLLYSSASQTCRGIWPNMIIRKDL